MSGYLIAEEGPLAGTIVSLLEEKPSGQWTLGRDPDLCDVLLEDPMVSRKHAIIALTPEGYTLENLSSVNPATQNGKIIAEQPVLLKEGDILQIGSTFFRFTEETPAMPISEEAPSPEEEVSPEPVSEVPFGATADTRWLLKVVSGPNAGAEFAMRPGKTYVIGKDPATCDIIFQDLSVSRQHARLNIDENDNVSIEDMGSRNGIIVNGELVTDKQLLHSQDLVALGTTTFLVIDRQQARETIVSPPITAAGTPAIVKTEAHAAPTAVKEKRNWHEMVIPKRHLLIAGVFVSAIFVCVIAMFSLFKAESIVVKQVDESVQVKEILTKFPAVQFSFNQNTGKLFLAGHLLTTVEKQEMTYMLKQLPFVEDIEDNVIVDDLVWKSMNDLLSTNQAWASVSVYSPMPGKFVLRGYLQTMDQQQALTDFINLNFPYLDKLDNQVVVEKNLQSEVQTMLAEKNYSGITFELANGEVVFTGRIEESKNSHFLDLLKELKKVPGVRTVKNYVVTTTADTSQVDLSEQYQITGTSKRDEKDYFVVINGRILGQGDLLDGMMITRVEPKSVLLEKDGLKYKINYNLQ